VAVEQVLAPKWSPAGLWQRLRATVKRPSDIFLALRLGYFVWRIPSHLQVSHLSRLLDAFRVKPRPPARSLEESLERIRRLGEPWLRLPGFHSRNTCYVRALLLYRFLDAGDGDMQIHFVVEPARNPAGRLRGHAWVTVEGQVLDVEDPDVIRRSHELYSYPPARS
jgi:hypothetical protein